MSVKTTSPSSNDGGLVSVFVDFVGSERMGRQRVVHGEGIGFIFSKNIFEIV